MHLNSACCLRSPQTSPTRDVLSHARQECLVPNALALSCPSLSLTPSAPHASSGYTLLLTRSAPPQFAVDWAMSGEDADGLPARRGSLVGFDPDASYQWWGPDDMFVTEQHPRGYARMLDAMVNDSVPLGDPRVVFDAEVTRIEYDLANCSGVQVSTKDGRTFKAREVISTLPLGVLQRRHNSLFDPPLPSEQAALLSPDSKFTMGNLTHVVVQFPTVWWNNDFAKWIAANKGSNESAAGGTDGGGANAAGEFAVWHNLNHESYLPGSKTLLTFLGDPQSSKYEALPFDAVQRALVARLRAQHPHTTVPDPTAFFMSTHGYDPKSYGAYSISLAGWNNRLHAKLAAPVKDSCGTTRVRMAGEAMCDNLNGYVGSEKR